jgi:hypothetical protein
LNDQEDHQRGADADGETKDIDQGKDLIAAEIPKRYKEIVFEHDAAI